MDSMKLLARLYELLSECTPMDLERAARLSGADNELSEALLIMAAVRRRSPARRVGPSPQSGRVVAGGHSKQVAVSRSNGIKGRVRETLLDQKLLPSNKNLIKYIKDAGVDVNLSTKDGRKRIVSKTMKWLDSLPAGESKRVYTRLLRILPPSETSGWFEVIRSSGP